MRADQFEKKERQLRAALEETTCRLGRHFANPAARATAGAYLQSLLSSVERKNSWQLAEVAGFDTPYRFQHLLGRGAWEADALRDEQLGVVLAGLGEDDAVLAIDDGGFCQAGQEERGRQAPVLRGFGQDRQLPGRRVPVLADGPGPCAHRPRALLA